MRVCERGKRAAVWERDTQAAKDVVAAAGDGGGGGFHIIHYRCPLQRGVATAPSEGGPTPTPMATATRFSCVCVCVLASLL